MNPDADPDAGGDTQPPANWRARARRWSPVLLLALLTLIALAQRTARTHDLVFPPADVLYQGIDAWYHARLISHAAVTGERLRHDPYLRMPDGAPVGVGPLFDDLGAWAARIALGGRLARGDDETDLLRVRRVAAWLPAFLGALVVVPLVLLARSLWGPAAGWIAGIGYLAVPGQILSRSVLGATDHHVGEVLFSTMCLAAIAASLRLQRQERTGRGLAWAVFAGLALAAYQLTWIAGMLLPCLLIAWLGASVALGGTRAWLAVDGFRAPRSLLDTATVAAIVAATALLVVAPQVDGVRVLSSGRDACVVLLGASLVVAIGLRLAPGLSRGFGIALVTALFVVGLGLSLQFDLWSQFTHWASFLRPRAEAGTVREAAPLLALGASLGPVWNELGIGWLVALPGLFLLGRSSLRPGRPAELLLLIWSICALVLTLAQNRFGYYLGVVSILAATCCLATLARHLTAPGDGMDRIRPGQRWASALFVVGVVFLFVAPNLRQTVARTASRPTIPPAWLEALDWIETETADPFGDTTCRFATDDASCRASDGVFTWWDYGYWLIERAGRVPYTNPTQAGAGEAARLLLADAQEAVAELESLRAELLIVDATMGYLQIAPGNPLGKFRAITTWAGEDPRQFARLARLRNGAGEWVTTTVYFPRYFRTLVGRVASNGVAATEPEGTALLEFEADPDLIDEDPVAVRRTTWFTDFDSARAAMDDLSEEARTRSRFATFDPMQTPVPLPPLRGLEEVFRSDDAIARRSDGDIPRLRVLRLGDGVVATPASELVSNPRGR